MNRHPAIGQHRLASGVTVRLRLPLRSDARALVTLGERLGVGVSPFALVRFDPRSSAVIVASVFEGATERLVGVATGDLDRDVPPALVLADDESGELHALLVAALAERSALRAGRVA